jgi:integrase/recombinase XerD
MQLHDGHGQRLYVTESERAAFLEAAAKASREVRTFCLVLALTGCRISEALALTPKSIDFGNQAIVFETLKKRKSGVYRAVPVPETLLDTLSMAHGINEPSRGRKRPLDKPLWGWVRKTAWLKVTTVMKAAGIAEGPHRSPKGLRHGYGVLAISKGVPLNMLSKWMGHASLEVTAIYANALGEEQRNIAARMWA